MNEIKTEEFKKWREENDHLLDTYNDPEGCMFIAWLGALEEAAKVADAAVTYSSVEAAKRRAMLIAGAIRVKKGKK